MTAAAAAAVVIVVVGIACIVYQCTSLQSGYPSAVHAVGAKQCHAAAVLCLLVPVVDISGVMKQQGCESYR